MAHRTNNAAAFRTDDLERRVHFFFVCVYLSQKKESELLSVFLGVV
jgi:hypothetical protein